MQQIDQALRSDATGVDFQQRVAPHPEARDVLFQLLQEEQLTHALGHGGQHVVATVHQLVPSVVGAYPEARDVLFQLLQEEQLTDALGHGGQHVVAAVHQHRRGRGLLPAIEQIDSRVVGALRRGGVGGDDEQGGGGENGYESRDEGLTHDARRS